MTTPRTYAVLVVDDYEPWRQHITSTLRKHPIWQIAAEAANGFDAVQKALAIAPDLILLDIGLPVLDGLQAARRILARHPASKILFVSEHRSRDIVEAALACGACGYVVKSDIARDLLPAMTAAIEGKRFVSATAAASIAPAPVADLVLGTPRRHEAGFYSNEPALVDGYAEFAASALEAGTTCVVVTSDSRRTALERVLRARGLDIDAAVRNKRYVAVEAGETLAGIMVEGWPDEGRFLAAATSLLKGMTASTTERPRLAACGECAPLLWRQGRGEAAVRLEHLWDEFARTHGVDIFCAYSLRVPSRGEDSRIFQRICAEHSAIRLR